MRLLVGLCLLLAAGAAAVLTLPRWEPTVEQLVPQSSRYLPALASPSPSPGPVQLEPAITPEAADPSATPLFTPPTPPAPGPVTLAVPGLPWIPAECRFVLLAMGDDSNDDTAEANALQDGTDHRWSPALVPWFRTVAARWAAVVDQAQGICAQYPPVTGPTVLPSPDQVQTALGWFAQAIASHRGWETTYGRDAWDDAWIAIYQRMTALYQRLP